jgi:uncharacterized membrane protein YhiD involved in acid resistance
MSFQDVLRNIEWADLPNRLSVSQVTMTLVATFLLGLIIFLTYKNNYNSISYNHTFNVSLIIMALITSMIILTISSNIILSLGMVGALSIVRFRSAIKDPMDIVYLFWSISLGITTGAGLYSVALIASLFISVAIFLLMRLTNSLDIFLLVIQYERKADLEVLDELANLEYTLKSKRAYGENLELTVELKRVSKGTHFVEEIKDINGVQQVSFITYNGEFIE